MAVVVLLQHAVTVNIVLSGHNTAQSTLLQYDSQKTKGLFTLHCYSIINNKHLRHVILKMQFYTTVSTMYT